MQPLFNAFQGWVSEAPACAMGARAWSHWLAQPLMVKTCSTARGEQSEVQLDDGSRLWLDGATRHEGSWWPTWVEWLAANGSNKSVPARAIKDGIEPAPGSYAKMP